MAERVGVVGDGVHRDQPHAGAGGGDDGVRVVDHERAPASRTGTQHVDHPACGGVAWVVDARRRGGVHGEDILHPHVT